jgi:hypothetical protein
MCSTLTAPYGYMDRRGCCSCCHRLADGAHLQKDNLVAVRRVLALAGYERTYDPAEADLVWAWKTPFW